MWGSLGVYFYWESIFLVTEEFFWKAEEEKYGGYETGFDFKNCQGAGCCFAGNSFCSLLVWILCFPHCIALFPEGKLGCDRAVLCDLYFLRKYL